MTMVKRTEESTSQRHLEELTRDIILDAGYEIMMGNKSVSEVKLIQARNLVGRVNSQEIKQYYEKIYNNYKQKWGELP
ncbi:MAG TPA: hypothetical protein VJH92_06285 [Candidatus Nanoarchaeia archaeon]|nr:hypothetical protein [Candidatus Nanoarchaeia archaeon]